MEEPVKEDRKPPETEAAQLHGQSLRRFVRNTVTNDQGQRDATLEGKVREKERDIYKSTSESTFLKKTKDTIFSIHVER